MSWRTCVSTLNPSSKAIKRDLTSSAKIRKRSLLFPTHTHTRWGPVARTKKEKERREKDSKWLSCWPCSLLLLLDGWMIFCVCENCCCDFLCAAADWSAVLEEDWWRRRRSFARANFGASHLYGPNCSGHSGRMGTEHGSLQFWSWDFVMFLYENGKVKF